MPGKPGRSISISRLPGALAGLVRQNLAKDSPGTRASRIALTVSPMGGNPARLAAVARRFASG